MVSKTNNLKLTQFSSQDDPVFTQADYSSDMLKIDDAVTANSNAFRAYQSGSVQLSITASSVASASVTFPKAYASNPIVVLTSNSSNVQLGVNLGVSGLSATGFTVYAYSTSNVGNWFVYWMAMPRG